MKNLEVHEQEEGVISLRKLTRIKEETRVSLCTTQLFSAICPLMISRYAVVQTNAVAAVVNLSLEKTHVLVLVLFLFSSTATVGLKRR
ncbi:hypothetical protein L1049_016863 [Liquidambar formosana]|uniref:Uncharacterized protein n=1 Tax=Liquidambar formosana TaxID=63359 RepID=A0AAP0S6Q0_LIQFO